jgi:probable HAF family extracellular repeat protein
MISFGPGWTETLDSNFGNPAYSGANDVNNNSQLVGFLRHTAGDKPIAFLFDFNTLHLTTIGTLPGGSTSMADALNDSGKVVGTSQTGGGSTHAFLFQDLNHNGLADPGEMTDLDTSGSADSGALSINSSGVAVGYFGSDHAINYGNSKAAVFINGKLTDLNTLVHGGTGGWTLTRAGVRPLEQRRSSGGNGGVDGSNTGPLGISARGGCR